MNGQKPGIPLKNWLLFIGATILVYITYFFIESKFFPKPHVVTAQEKRELFDQVAPIAELAPMGGGLGDLWAFAGAELARSVPPEKRALALAQAEEAKKKAVAAAPKPPPVPAFKPQFIQLGDKSYNLWVRLTTKGGGVDRVIVPAFPQADRLGKAVRNADGTPQPLHLIPSPEDRPEDERKNLPHDALLPSFLLYHYAEPTAVRPEPTLGEQEWKQDRNLSSRDEGSETVALTTDLPDFGVKITKIFTLSRRDYHIGLTLKFEKLPNANPKPLRYQLSGGHRLPIEGFWYTSVYRNFVVGLKDEKGNVNRHLETAQEIHTNLGSDPTAGLRGSGEIQYAATATQFFVSATCVDETQPDRTFIERARATAEADDQFPKEKLMLGDIATRLVSTPLTVGDAPVEHKFLLYHGPVKVRQLYQVQDFPVDDATVERYEKSLNLRTLTDFHSDNWIGRFANMIGWSDLTIAFTNIMHAILGFFLRNLPHPVLAIIALTILVRLMLMPLSRRQTANMAKMQEKMAALQPKMKELEAKYKDNQNELHQAKLKLMMEHGINPAGQLGGCLLLFAQMPVFMGLYYALQENVFFRLQRFLWIENLAAPDMLFPWGEGIRWISQPEYLGNIFYLGPYFNILPLIAVGLMILQQWLVTPPAADEQQKQQQFMMKLMMGMMALFFYKTASGLVLYFTISSLWGLAERKLFPKKTAAKPGEGGGGGGGGGGDSGGNGAKLKDKPKPPESWMQRKMREVLEAAQKRDNTARRGPGPKKLRPR
jgi:YidC/Oxa1 family membrane protein insertase